MEQEMKWRADAAIQQSIFAWCAPLCVDDTRYQMDACYYDTPDGFLAAQHAGLRLRTENGKCVCCLKCGGDVSESGLHTREEYEYPADTIREGVVHLLKKAGAPAHICLPLLEKGVDEVCRVAFTRTALLLQVQPSPAHPTMTAELALDNGALHRGARTCPFAEVELEHKSGDVQAFLSFAAQLAQTFYLQPEPLSKLARAISL